MHSRLSKDTCFSFSAENPVKSGLSRQFDEKNEKCRQGSHNTIYRKDNAEIRYI